MSKILVLAASAAVALVSVAATSDADARYVRIRAFRTFRMDRGADASS